MRISLVLALSLLLLSCSVQADVVGCTNDGEFAFDVMNRGDLNSAWSKGDETLKDSDSTEMDFLYVTIFGKHDKLNINQFQILQNNTLAANSTIFLEKVVDHGENKTYSIRVNYRCNENAGLLMRLNFRVKNNFISCKNDNSDIFWVRKCGDNEPPRMGLSVDYSIKHRFNHTIVENGRLVDADYFSEDYDTYVLRIPPRQKQSFFYAFLNLTEDIYTHNDIKLEDIDKKKIDEKLLTHEMQLLKILEVKKVELNYDVQLLDVTLKGSFVNGGFINSERSIIFLEYKCLRGGISGIQLTIEMDHFKNVNIFFEKECPLQPGEASGLLGTFAFIILVAFVFTIIATLYNVFIYEVRGVKAVPFAVTLLTGLSKIPGLKGTSVGDSLYNLAHPVYGSTLSNDTINASSNQVSQHEQDYQESEFKIKNITEKEGDDETNLDDSAVLPQNHSQVGNYGSI